MIPTSVKQIPSRDGRAEIGIRAMTSGDLPDAALLSKALGWPHRLEDWDFMLRQGHGLVATLENGAVIGTILWWPFGTRYATVGLVIVANAWQGHGIGRTLLATVRRLLPGYSLYLNATPAGQPLYEKLGFIPTGIVEQHQGNGVSAPIVPLEPGHRLRPVVQQDLQELAALDGAATGMDRARLIEDLVATAKGVVIDTGDGIVGYSFCRKFGWGWLIGPVAAATPIGARALIAHWIGTHGGEFLRVDIPAACGLSSWLDDMGLIRVDTVNTMSTDAMTPAPDGPCYYALTSQAIG
ncbi:GNAT family N-acetyltransferase [Nguyenibacter vanlangensis]|uniref:GNAT family N-acetyltransferase n=1 Tax=Nguyenibacter vanlangensis TaxID=1216886 RepID=A0ABZ3DB27_9PROT